MNSRTFDKVERICDTLDEEPALWVVYGDTIRDILIRAEEEILKLRADKVKLYGTTNEKQVTIRAEQMRWKRILWQTRPHICECCGCKLTWAIHRIHHKVAVAEGGKFCDDNLEVLCANCHLETHTAE